MSEYPGIEMTLATNHLGGFLLTHELLRFDCFNNKYARIVIVSSSLHDPDIKSTVNSLVLDLDNLDGSKGYTKMDFYKRSKLCNLWFMYQLAKILPLHITANALSPGFIPSTELGRNSGFLGNILMKWVLPLFPFRKSLAYGAEAYIQLILDPTLLEISGKYFVDRQICQSSIDSLDEAKQLTCWKWSCEAVGIVDYGK
jgi:NAD(P)-dependent dehydrogenase (short-subunit alcohol dehydrogenase family)